MGHKFLGKLVVYLFMYEHPLHPEAVLAGLGKGARCNCRHRLYQIGIGLYDNRRVGAQFEREALAGPGGGLANDP